MNKTCGTLRDKLLKRSAKLEVRIKSANAFLSS